MTANLKEWFKDLHEQENIDVAGGEGQVALIKSEAEKAEDDKKKWEKRETFRQKLSVDTKIVPDFNEAVGKDDKGVVTNANYLDEEGPEYRFKMEDFWLKGEQERAQRIFKMMHPLIFLSEKQPAYTKIQYNWVFQTQTT